LSTIFHKENAFQNSFNEETVLSHSALPSCSSSDSTKLGLHTKL